MTYAGQWASHYRQLGFCPDVRHGLYGGQCVSEINLIVLETDGVVGLTASHVYFYGMKSRG